MKNLKAAPTHRLSPPPASLRKRLVHTFYLVQPVIQFFALVAIIGILSRCSPLAPSTDKTFSLKGKSGNPELEKSENILSASRDDLISANLIDISTPAVQVTSDDVYERDTRNSVARESENIDDSRLSNRLKNRIGSSARGEPRKIRKLLSLILNNDQTSQLVEEGLIRIDLSQSMVLSEKGKKLFFNAMQEALHAKDVKKLDARSYVIFADDAALDAHKDLTHSIHLKILASIILEESQGFLEIRVDGANADARRDAVADLAEALRDAGRIAIVLD